MLRRTSRRPHACAATHGSSRRRQGVGACPPPMLVLFTRCRDRSAVDIVTSERTFADVELPPATMRTLAQRRDDAFIFERRGLGERRAIGLGSGFTLAGPPATGKTIYAEAIAYAVRDSPRARAAFRNSCSVMPHHG